MICLNVGNLFTHQYLDKVIELNQQYEGKGIRVSSLFGSIAGLGPTARSIDRLPHLEKHELGEYIDKAQRNNINIRYTLNTSCIGSLQEFTLSWYSFLRRQVKELHEIGVHEWTITSPLLVELVRELFSKDSIEVSTIAEVATLPAAKRWQELGADGVNISTDINWSPIKINQIASTGLQVSILVNESCLYKCPWRRDCYNLSSHNSIRSNDLFEFYPFARCNTVRLQHPVEWVRSRMVMPSWLDMYYNSFGVTRFKVAYRTHPYEVAIPILEYYMAKKNPPSLLDLWPTVSHLGSTPEPKDQQFIPTAVYTETLLSKIWGIADGCDLIDCASCGFCDRLYEKAVARASRENAG